MKPKTLVQKLPLRLRMIVRDMWTEPGEDGYFACLIDGYNVDGCSTVHERTLKAMRQRLATAVPGEPY